MSVSPLLVIIGAPLLGVLALLFRVPGRLVALGSTGLMCVGALWAAACMPAAGGMQYRQGFDWLEAGGIRVTMGLGVDGFSLPFVILTCVVALAAVLATPRNMPRAAEFYACLLLIAAGAAGSFLATDLVFLYIFHELALVPTFLGIGIWGDGPRRVFVTFQTVVYLMAGSMVLLAGILGLLWALRAASGVAVVSTDLVALRDLAAAHAPGMAAQRWVFGFLLIGFGTLVGLFPFHTWAPRAYAVAPAPIAMLHAGVLKKFGIYGLIRVGLAVLPSGADAWREWLLVLLLGNILVIGWAAVQQKQLNDMLGYSSVMHMGYLFLGVAAGTNLGLTGVALLSVGHGLSIAGLFAVSGMVLERSGTLAMGQLGGIASRLPTLGFAFSVLGLASIGLPGLANFAGEISILFGSWGAHGDLSWGPMPALSWGVVAAAFGLILSAVYMLRATKAVFFGPGGSVEVEAGPIPMAWRASVFILIGCLLVVGMAPAGLSMAASSGLAEWLGGVAR
ncbi:MAG TPA: NADH-quinone oxidoreductase subunit M [Verrucomicrobiae bacterium]|nr:NADH-quinone oxidoreductase subunit M [Verrucomicrobiae bacterium]